MDAMIKSVLCQAAEMLKTTWVSAEQWTISTSQKSFPDPLFYNGE